MIIYSLKSLEESTKHKTTDYISDLFIKHSQVGLVIAKKKKKKIVLKNPLIINRSERKKTLFSEESGNFIVYSKFLF